MNKQSTGWVDCWRLSLKFAKFMLRRVLVLWEKHKSLRVKDLCTMKVNSWLKFIIKEEYAFCDEN